jgi:tetratricopeptide (TPR) repeat protein
MRIASYALAGLAVLVMAVTAAASEQDVQALRKRADNALERGYYSRAVELYQRVTEARPDSSSAIRDLAHARFLAGDHAGAWQDIRQSLQLNPVDEKANAYADQIRSMIRPRVHPRVGMAFDRFIELAGTPQRIIDFSATRRRVIYYDLWAYEFDRQGLVRQVSLDHVAPDQPLDDMLPRLRGFKLDGRSWQLDTCERTFDSAACTYIPDDQLDRHTEQAETITVRRTVADTGPIVKMAKRRYEKLSETIPTMRWRVVDEGNNSLLAEWGTGREAPTGQPSYHLVYDFADGAAAITLEYKAPRLQLDPEPRAAWIDYLKHPVMKNLYDRAADFASAD